MTTGSPDLRPFRERVLELIEIVSPGSGLKPASEVLNRLRGRIGSWVDERLRLYERASAEVEELRADRVKLQGEIERLTHELAEAHATRPFPPDLVQRIDELPRDFEERKRTATDIEALAQRLAKVEDRLVRLNSVAPELNKRINRVCDISGERIGGLEERLDEFETRAVNLLDAHSTDIAALKFPDGEKQDGAAFPTGAGTTAEDAIAQAAAEAWTAALTQEPPVEDGPLKPKRGDRVRLEGGCSIGNTKLEDRWYDVTGATEQDFQVEAGVGRFWVLANDPGLKEVRRGAAKLPE